MNKLDYKDKKVQEFFKKAYKTVNVFSIDENTKPNWQYLDRKYYVIDHSEDYRYAIAAVYKTEPFTIDCYVVLKENEVIKREYNLDSAGIFYDLIRKGEKLK